MSYANIFSTTTVVTSENGENRSTTLIYRGQVYQCLPQTQKKVEIAEFKNVELTYRGQTYNCVSPVVSYRSPRAVNWRFQVAQ